MSEEPTPPLSTVVVEGGPEDETDTPDRNLSNLGMSTSSLFSISSQDQSIDTESDKSDPSVPRASALSTTTALDTKFLYTGDPPTLRELDRRYKHVMVDHNLTKLPAKCFAKCFSLQHVDLHNQLSEMGEQAFSFCRSLQDITIPSSIPHLPYQTLSGCGRLKTVKLQNGLQSVGMQAFQQCSKLKLIELPSTMNSLGNAAFKGCYDLQHVIFAEGSNLKVLAAHTFCMCYSLQEIELPSSVEELGDECFSNCVSLRKVTRRVASVDDVLPPMKVIGHGCFLQCMALVELSIGDIMDDKVTYMGEMVFEGCGQLDLGRKPRATLKMSQHSRESIRNSLVTMSTERGASIRESMIMPLLVSAVEEEGEEEI